MANCCVCGKKLRFSEAGMPFSMEIKEDICSSCSEHKYNLDRNTNELEVAKIEQSIEFFEEIIKQGIADPKCIDAIKELIEKGKNKVGTLKEKAKIHQENVEKIRNIKTTTGFNFEGYKIIDYKDVINSEVVIGTGIFSEISAQVSDVFGTTSSGYTGKLSAAKQLALKGLHGNAVAKGCNAIIGIDFDIMTIGANMIVVSANGTAVVIEKES